MVAYREFVLAGVGKPSPLEQVRHQTLLGDDAFLARHKTCAGADHLREVSKAHRRAVASDLADYRAQYSERAEAMARAYLSGAYTMAEIADLFGVHAMTVSRAVKLFGRIQVRQERV